MRRFIDGGFGHGFAPVETEHTLRLRGGNGRCRGEQLLRSLPHFRGDLEHLDALGESPAMLLSVKGRGDAYANESVCGVEVTDGTFVHQLASDSNRD